MISRVKGLKLPIKWSCTDLITCKIINKLKLNVYIQFVVPIIEIYVKYANCKFFLYLLVKASCTLLNSINWIIY